jgi:CRP/FNR family cyclic AMP-dependent transcriptional regulator
MSQTEPNKTTDVTGRSAPHPGLPESDPFTAVRKLPFFVGASEAAVARCAARARWRSCAAGEVVVDTGDATDDVYFILSGAVRVMVRTVFGYEAILNDQGAGSFFGELAAIDNNPRSANVTALLRTQLCVVPGESFMELVLSSPALGRRFLRLLARRLRNKDERLIEFSVLSVRQRLIAELLRLSRDRGGGERVLSPPPPQHVLAARIGARRESISRELKEMSRAGLVTVGRRAIILDRPDLLQAEVQARLHGPLAAVRPARG